MNKKICLITGGTAGIGLATAKELAQKDFEIILTARNDEKGKTAVDEIKQISGNKDVSYLTADLSSLQSVRTLFGKFSQQHQQLHVLINNAGAFYTERHLSTDKYEMQFAVNHLSHFLLTNLLLDTIKKSAPARIINLTSRAHRRGKIHFDDLHFSSRKYDGVKAYAQSKLANIYFTHSLAKKLEGTSVSVNSVHPGGINTNIAFNHSSGFYRWAWTIARALTLKPVEEGAKTSIYLASSPEIENINGKYFAKCKAVPSSKASYDEATAEKLWKVSEELTGLTDS